MTRIIAGAHGGRRLAAPAGAQTRPTSDRVREAFFSALETMVDLDGARFADLYAGSGAVGLEALSRGATSASAGGGRREGGPGDPGQHRRAPGRRRRPGWSPARWRRWSAAPPEGGPYDVVFADPPYAIADDEVTEVQQALVDNGWLAPDAVVVIERSTRRRSAASR